MQHSGSTYVMEKFYTNRIRFLSTIAKRLKSHIQSLPINLPSLSDKTLKDIVAYILGYEDSHHFIQVNNSKNSYSISAFDEDLNINAFLKRRENQHRRLLEAISKFTNGNPNITIDEHISDILNDIQPTAKDPYLPLHLVKDISSNCDEIIRCISAFYLEIALVVDRDNKIDSTDSLKFFESNIKAIVKHYCLLLELKNSFVNNKIPKAKIYELYETIDQGLKNYGNTSASKAVEISSTILPAGRFKDIEIIKRQSANYRLNLIGANYFDIVVRLLRNFIFHYDVTSDNTHIIKKLLNTLNTNPFDWSTINHFFHNYAGVRQGYGRYGSKTDLENLEFFYKETYADTFKGNAVDKAIRLTKAFEVYINKSCSKQKISTASFYRKYPSLIEQQVEFYEAINPLDPQGAILLLKYIEVCSKLALVNKKRTNIDKVLILIESCYYHLRNNNMPEDHRQPKQPVHAPANITKPISLTDKLEPHCFLKNEARSRFSPNLRIDLVILAALSFCSFDILRNINQELLPIKINKNYMSFLMEFKKDQEVISSDLEIAKDILSNTLKNLHENYNEFSFVDGRKFSTLKNDLLYGLSMQGLIFTISKVISQGHSDHLSEHTKGGK